MNLTGKWKLPLRPYLNVKSSDEFVFLLAKKESADPYKRLVKGEKSMKMRSCKSQFTTLTKSTTRIKGGISFLPTHARLFQVFWNSIEVLTNLYSF